MGGFGQAFEHGSFQLHLLDQGKEDFPIHMQVKLRFGWQAGALKGGLAGQLAHGQDRFDRAGPVLVLPDLQQGSQHPPVDIEQFLPGTFFEQLRGAAFQARAQQDRPADDEVRVSAAALDRVGTEHVDVALEPADEIRPLG